MRRQSSMVVWQDLPHLSGIIRIERFLVKVAIASSAVASLSCILPTRLGVHLGVDQVRASTFSTFSQTNIFFGAYYSLCVVHMKLFRGLVVLQ